jgi:hypothetical protein
MQYAASALTVRGKRRTTPSEMNRRVLKRVWMGVLLVAVLFFYRALYHFVGGYSGVAADVRGLGRVYKDAGQTHAAFYTNTFLQQMPFNQPIIWNYRSFRSSYVCLTSRVDVVVFKRKMSAEPFTDLYLAHGKPVAMFTIDHRFGNLVVHTTGQLNLSSGEFSMESRELERMLNDEDWRHLTNGGIDFDFSEKAP